MKIIRYKRTKCLQYKMSKNNFNKYAHVKKEHGCVQCRKRNGHMILAIWVINNSSTLICVNIH